MSRQPTRRFQSTRNQHKKQQVNRQPPQPQQPDLHDRRRPRDQEGSGSGRGSGSGSGGLLEGFPSTGARGGQQQAGISGSEQEQHQQQRQQQQPQQLSSEPPEHAGQAGQGWEWPWSSFTKRREQEEHRDIPRSDPSPRATARSSAAAPPAPNQAAVLAREWRASFADEGRVTAEQGRRWQQQQQQQRQVQQRRQQLRQQERRSTRRTANAQAAAAEAAASAMERQRQPSSRPSTGVPLPSSFAAAVTAENLKSVEDSTAAAAAGRRGPNTHTPRLDDYIKQGKLAVAKAAAASASSPSSGAVAAGGEDANRETTESRTSLGTEHTSSTNYTFGTTTTYGGGMSTKTPMHKPKPDKAGYNRKWTDVAFTKYKMGMSHYRAHDFDSADLCFNHVLRIRKSLRQDKFNHPDVLNASKMEARIAYMKKKMERARRKKTKRAARARRMLVEKDRLILVQAEEDAAELRQRGVLGGGRDDDAPADPQAKSEGVRMPMKPPATKGSAVKAAARSGRKSSRRSRSREAIRRDRSRSRESRKRSAPQAASNTRHEEDALFEPEVNSDDRKDKDKNDDGKGSDLERDLASFYSSGSVVYGTSTEDEGEDEDVSIITDISDLSASVYTMAKTDSNPTSNENSGSFQSAGTGTGEGASREGSEENSYTRQHQELVHMRVRRSSMPLEPEVLDADDEKPPKEKRKKKRRSSTGALQNEMLERALEMLNVNEHTMKAGDDSAPATEKQSTSVLAPVRPPSSLQQFTSSAPPDAAPPKDAPTTRSGQSFEFLKFMDAVKKMSTASLEDEELVKRNNVSKRAAIGAAAATTLATLDEQNDSADGEGEEYSDEEYSDESSEESYGSDATPEDFDEDEFSRSLATSYDDDDDEKDSGDEQDDERYGEAFDEFTAASERPLSVVAGIPTSGASIVSAMNESTSSDWQEEQSFVAKSRRTQNLRSSDTNGEGGTVSGLSLEDWQKFKKAAKSIYAANAQPRPSAPPAQSQKKTPASDAISRANSYLTKPRSVELQHEYSVASSMVDTTASDWYDRQRDTDDPPDDVQALEDVSAGNYALSAGSYEEAKKRFISALRKMVRILGPDHEEVSLIQEMLGDACARLGEVKEAHGQYQLARQNLQEKLGRHDRNVTRIMVSLGGLYFDSGNYSRALKYHASILELRRENLDDDHPDVLESVEKNMEVHEAMVARALSMNDQEMALFHAREIIWLALSSETNEPEVDKAEVLDLVQDVQNSYAEAGVESKEDTKPRTYYNQAKKMLKQAGGSTNVGELSAMMDNVAGILLKEKKTDSALKCYEEKLDFLERHQVDDNTLTCNTLRKLGSLCNKCGQYEDAIAYQQKAMTLYELDLDNFKSEYERTLRSLASSNLASGNYSVSLKHFKAYLTSCGVQEKSFILFTMGVLYSKMYQIAEALNCYRKALQIESTASGEEDKETLASISHLQDIFLSTKKRPKESSCYEKALDSQDMKQILVNLGYVQLKNRTHKRAGESQIERHTMKSVRHFAREILGYLNADGETLDITCVLRSMGNVLSRRRRYKEAIEYYDKFISAKKRPKKDIYVQHYHQEMFESLTDLGTAYLKTKEKEKAFASFQRALDELESCTADKEKNNFSVEDNLKALVAKKDEKYDSGHATNVDHLMALLICELKLYDSSATMLEEVRDKKVSAIGSSNPDTAKVFIDLSQIVMLQGDIKSGRKAFDNGMRRLQQEKLPFFHPYMSQLRRLYSFLNSRKQ